jgi:hypothetical protein
MDFPVKPKRPPAPTGKGAVRKEAKDDSQ